MGMRAGVRGLLLGFPPGASGTSALAVPLSIVDDELTLVQWLAPESGYYQDVEKTTPATRHTDLVTVWADQSGHGYDSVAPAGGPVLNAYTHWPASVIWRTGNAAFFKSGAIPAMDSDKQTVFIVAYYDSLNTGLATKYLHASTYTSGNNVEIRATAAGPIEGRVGAYVSASAAPLSQEFHVIALRWREDNKVTLYDGLTAFSPSNANSSVPSGHYSNILTSYPTGTGVQNWVGPVAEILVYVGRDMTDDEFALIVNYLTEKHKRDFRRLSARVWQTGVGAEDWIGRPMLADDDGTWIVAYQVTDAHSNPGALHVKFSENEGVNWTAQDVFTDDEAVTGLEGVGGGAMLYRIPNGDLLLFGGAAGVNSQWRSTDGGKTWAKEGALPAAHFGQEVIAIGATLYAAGWDTDPPPGYHSVLYKSEDNAATWTKVSDITIAGEKTDEPSIAHRGGTTLLAVLRDSDRNKTYKRLSDDLGETWGALIDITAQVGVIQRPRLRRFADEPNRLYLFGRDYILTGETVTGATVVLYSDDEGVSWSQRWWADLKDYEDSAYCDVLKRTDGSFYMLTYNGTFTAANMVEIVFEAAA